MTTIESAGVTRPVSVTRALLLLLASITIAALLLGLVGMHALSVGAQGQRGHGGHSQMSSGMPSDRPMTAPLADSVAPATVASEIGNAGGGATAPGCGGMCEMNCLLLGMVCALSLLVALIGLVLGKRPSPPASAVRRVTRILRIDTAVRVVPAPPSLHAFSISRT